MRKKTTVYLDHSERQALKRRSKEQGLPEAVMIREAIDEYLAEPARPALRSLGIAKGPRTLARDTEKLLAEGFGKPTRARRR